MKKIISILAVGFALLANADYIYWMVDNPATGNDISGSPVDGGFNWSTAVLSIQNDGRLVSGITATSFDGATATLSSTAAATLASYDAYATANIGTGYSGKNFLIELFADNGSWMAGYSVSAADSAIAKYIFSENSMSTMPAQGFGQGVTYAVPEPTSGLLFLVGGMLLGLKRRRQKV